MKNYYKTGILVILLVVPVLVYLFLKTFGENHYRIQRFIPVEITEKNINGIIVNDTLFHKVPEFEVIDQNGNSIAGIDFKNKIFVANFFFTRCPGICPKMTANLVKVQDTFIKDTLVKLVSITVDTDYDTPQILKKYGEKYSIEAKKWTLGTMRTKLDVFNLGFYGFKVPSDTVDKFLHSDKLILVDKEKIIRGFYDGTDKAEIDRLITEIKVLEYEYEHPNN
ncbi:MAG: SCO family protein [Bacteroidota bacterium]|nr:SCO family protein [Bacteroidota bacterium]